MLLAAELSRRGELAGALSHFMRAVELDPTDPDHASNAASTLIDLGRLDEAAALLDRALALSPDHAYALSNRSRLLEREGRYEEAERTAPARAGAGTGATRAPGTPAPTAARGGGG